jgi:hypothetical protein
VSRLPLALDTDLWLLLGVGRAERRSVAVHKRLGRCELRRFDRVGLVDLGLLTSAERGTEVLIVDFDPVLEGERRGLPVRNFTRITDPTR